MLIIIASKKRITWIKIDVIQLQLQVINKIVIESN